MSDPKHVFDYTEWDTGLSKCRHPDHRGGFSPVCWEANARQAGWISPSEVGDAQATENALVQQVVERERDRAHAAEQSLGEADAEIERLKREVARLRIGMEGAAGNHERARRALVDRAEKAERERDVEREHGDAARESNDRLMTTVARVAALADDLIAALDPGYSLPPMRTHDFLRKVEREIRTALETT